MAMRLILWRLGVGAALVVLLVALVIAVKLAPLFLAPNPYSGVTSVERLPVYRDPALLRTAWAEPVAVRYRRLSFEFQHNQSVCGPTSVSDVLHSLGRASTQEQVLADASKRTWFGYLLGGLTLDEAGALLSREAGQPAQVLRNLGLARFRAEMRLVNDPHYRIVAFFHRGPLFGRGHGHFSPLIAYLPDRDLVLVGDVNAAFRPFLVSTDRLWRAVDTVDADTGKRRGLIVLTTT